MRRLLPIALVLALPLSAGAPGQAALSKQALIQRLLKLTKAGELGLQAMRQGVAAQKQASPQIPEAFWSEFMKRFSVEQIEAMVLPVYERHFSAEELQALLNFFETPAGRAFLEKQPAIQQESMEAGQALGEKIGREVAQKLQAEGKL